jgi:pyridoxine 4-dehydrogenase
MGGQSGLPALFGWSWRRTVSLIATVQPHAHRDSGTIQIGYSIGPQAMNRRELDRPRCRLLVEFDPLSFEVHPDDPPAKWDTLLFRWYGKPMAVRAATLDDARVGTLDIADWTIRRLGFGAMRVSGARNSEGVRDREMAKALIRRAVDRGVNLIDTANIYGYGESEEIIAEAIHPYPADLLITTKAGFKPGKIVPGETSLPPLGTPEHIREECEKSLRRLRVDAIDLYQVHVPDPAVPYEETVGAFADLQRAGKIRHIGVSNVNARQLAVAQSICEVVTVENRYNVGDRASESLLTLCEDQGIAFVPWRPVAPDNDGARSALAEVAQKREVSLQQVALAWLLVRSGIVVPIPGTSDIDHLDDNINAGWLILTDSETAALDAAVGEDPS